MKSYPVKENLIGSTITEILLYKQTYTLLLCYKDKIIVDIEITERRILIKRKWTHPALRENY